jgi:hypothetical protein
MRPGRIAPLALLGLATLAGASPAAAFPKIEQLFCDVVTDVVDFVREQAPATAFCSSYLSIPVVTATTTTTVITAYAKFTQVARLESLLCSCPADTIVCSVAHQRRL